MVSLSLLFLTALMVLIQNVKSSDIILNENYTEISEEESIIESLEIIKKEYEQGKNLTDLIEDLQHSGEKRLLSSHLSANTTEVVPDPWVKVEAAMKNTTLETPTAPFNISSSGNCVKLASDVNIIFGSHRDSFQNAVAKCSRKALGSYKNTFRCISKLSFDGLKLSDQCNDCWSKTAHCGVKHCASQCLFNTCVTKCQKCSTRECSKQLNECAGTIWMPLPCGLSPHNPIPENFKVNDPK
ncbi:secreted with signal peptide and 12 KAZAL repeats and a mucin-like stretch of threonines [Cryptosporidium sp. chipmunk genotype I]|uniref:secreted with signal peptide and 12 KAZAL repeats and a mucin-like stretch of threonines n=1 Tax=Cryptosporidium sp. chipmunk genotype I TaxID=1280935 RepID=UPI00351A4FC3|nr:secreted with signal peptide and 12 KAZAL repeats and a mucin-like stretch of threonines [Cryptosporidium sp. chipmunk genotype I]